MLCAESDTGSSGGSRALQAEDRRLRHRRRNDRRRSGGRRRRPAGRVRSAEKIPGSDFASPIRSPTRSRRCSLSTTPASACRRRCTFQRKPGLVAADARHTPQMPRASARLEVSPTPSVVIGNRGATEQLHRARRATTHPGPYDAIFETLSPKIGKRMRSD